MELPEAEESRHIADGANADYDPRVLSEIGEQIVSTRQGGGYSLLTNYALSTDVQNALIARGYSLWAVIVEGAIWTQIPW